MAGVGVHFRLPEWEGKEFPCIDELPGKSSGSELVLCVSPVSLLCLCLLLG